MKHVESEIVVEITPSELQKLTEGFTSQVERMNSMCDAEKKDWAENKQFMSIRHACDRGAGVVI